VLLAKLEHALAFVDVSFFPDHAIVLWPELLAKTLAAPFACDKKDDSSDHDRCDHDQQNHDLRIHSPPPSYKLLAYVELWDSAEHGGVAQWKKGRRDEVGRAGCYRAG
jgi:hypothetical protein